MLSRARSVFARVRINVDSFGIKNAAHDVAIRAVNQAVYLRILEGVAITEPGRRPEDLPYRHGFAERTPLLEKALDPSYEMTTDFVQKALAKGDECYAIWDHDILASYGWYSGAPTFIEDDLFVRFDPRFAYMYKGFTHPQYRGQRLHALGMSLALQKYLDLGRRGLVSYVESNNFASLKSCHRMGYRGFGRVVVARAFGRYFIRSSRGCDAYGFAVEATRPIEGRPQAAV